MSQDFDHFKCATHSEEMRTRNGEKKNAQEACEIYHFQEKIIT